MANRDQQGIGIIVMTFLMASGLEVLPLFEEIMLLRPEWLAILLLYWVLALPHRVGVFWGFCVGLFMDVLSGSLLGQHSLAFALIAWLGLLIQKRMAVFPPWQQALVVFMVLGAGFLAAYMVQDAIGRAHLSPLMMLTSVLVSSVLWYPLTRLMTVVRQRFLVF